MRILNCPGCGDLEFLTVGQQREGIVIQESIEGRVFCQPQYSIRFCPDCGLYYKSDTLDYLDLSYYYQKVDFSKWDYKGLFPTERATMRALSQLLKGSQILDYGCGAGRLLSRLTHQYACFGIENNILAAQIAKSKGIRIITQKDISIPGTYTFDAILLCDVFEHLPHPTGVLTKLCQNLKPEGLLIVATGNADARACQNDIANFWYFATLEHLCMFSRKYANFLLEKLGLKLTSWSEVCHYDFRLSEKFFQYARNFIYWQFHGQRASVLKFMFKLIPFINRAQKWKLPPYFACSRDHVVAIFKKL